MKQLVLLLALALCGQMFGQKIKYSKQTKKLYSELYNGAIAHGATPKEAIIKMFDDPNYMNLSNKDLADANKGAVKKGILYSKEIARIGYHKKVAILPFNVEITDNVTKRKKQSKKQHVKDEANLMADVQEIIYTYLMKNRFDYTVEFQDITRTNQLLKASGMMNTLNLASTEELTELLGVDAIIRGDYSNSKDKKGIKDAFSVANVATMGYASLLSSNKKSTGEIKLGIFDGDSGDAVWRITMEKSSGGKNTNAVVEKVMKQVSKYFPYSTEFSKG